VALLFAQFHDDDIPLTNSSTVYATACHGDHNSKLLSEDDTIQVSKLSIDGDTCQVFD